MKKKLFAIILISILTLVDAQDEYVIRESYKIGPGCDYNKYVNASKPMQISVTTMDLKNPYLSIECSTSFDKLRGKETTSAASKRTSYSGHQAVCAVNGDFYDTSNGVPLTPCLVNGQFTNTPFSYRQGFGYLEEGKAVLFNPLFTGLIISRNSQASYELANVNEERTADEICMYNKFYNSTTGTSGDGAECVITAISDWAVNDTVICVVEISDSISNNRSIPMGHSVLSGNGAGAVFIRNYCQVGDTLEIVQSFPIDEKKITQFMGGACKMMENGINVAEESGMEEKVWSTYLTGRNPRTVIGFNEDSTLIYFIVVDGRQAGFSIGIGMNELVDFMMTIGVKNAVNLDGGGSSTMVVRHSVKNSPSDGGERAVANSVLCYSSAPYGEIVHIQIPCDSVNVYKGKAVNLGLTAWDEFYNPKGISDWDMIDFSYDTSFGSIDKNIFTANEVGGDCKVSASYNGDVDSITVHVIQLNNLSIYPKVVTSDSVNSIYFTVKASGESGISQEYDNEIFEFTVLDSGVGEISTAGVFKGKMNGETKVLVRYGDQYDTAMVKIEIGDGEVALDEIEQLSDWTLTADQFINLEGTNLELFPREAGTGNNAFKLNYSRTGNADGNIFLRTNPIEIYGLPSYILLDVLSDSIKHWVYMILEDSRGIEYNVKCSSSLRYNDDYRTQYMDMSNMLPADGEQLYPMKITGIRFRIDDKASEGSLFFDRIRLIYPGWTGIANDKTLLPKTFNLYQNFPNPFNPETSIKFELSHSGNVSLDIFDVNGNIVDCLINEYLNAGDHSVKFTARTLNSGVYFYRLRVGKISDTKKMILIK